MAAKPVRNTLSERVLRWARDRGVPRAGQRVGVAVSGGADSVALLLLFLELRRKLGVVLSVVHLNHKLRGRASDADEKFVAKLAVKQGLTLHVEHENVAEKARREKANLEDAARRARYAFFERLVSKEQLDWVAVAHTADDQAETVLAHILRGTGLAGLGGIHPVAGHVFRPVLGVRRAELRAYLRSKKQSWREDLTNRDTKRVRARIRRKLLPLLEKQFRPGVVEHLATLAELAREDEAALDNLASESYRKFVRTTSGRSTISTADLIWHEQRKEEDNAETQSARRLAEKANRGLGRRVVRLIVDEVKPGAGQLNAQHVDAVLRLAEHGENGKSLPLPGGVTVRREHDRLVFCGEEKTGSETGDSLEFEHTVKLRDKETLVRVPELGCAFRLITIDWSEKSGDTIETGSALDRDALRPPLVLRNWRPGDKLHPIGHRSAHKLKRLLNQKRVDRWERHGWPVLTSGGVLAWARGFPVAAEFAANERTRAGIVIAEEPIL